MPNPETYKADYAGRMSRHLFNLYDAGGQRQPFFTEIARHLQTELGSQESFVGITPVGSTVRGYSVQPGTIGSSPDEPSDLDFVILFDSSKDKNAERKLVDIANGEIALLKRRHQNERFPVIAPVSTHDLRSDRIHDFLQKNPSFLVDKDGINFIQGVSALAGLALGPGVNEYRHLIGQELRNLRPEQARNFVQHIGRLMSNIELRSIPRLPSKMKERMLGSTSEDEVNALSIKREKAWTDRAIKVFGLEL